MQYKVEAELKWPAQSESVWYGLIEAENAVQAQGKARRKYVKALGLELLEEFEIETVVVAVTPKPVEVPGQRALFG